ncbi:MAG TPA: STAS/SEC14 domain-containing protein [Solirubrobacteraceae bacterium]|nr:STAS/SEC14 domain-containing protein [Solirubrobacteraceae bacterium]
MIEPIERMPTGVIGLRASGRLTVGDYRDVLEPVLRREFESGELRLLFELSDWDGLEPGAWIEDMKTGLGTWVRDYMAWRRFALVTDVDWVANATRMFAWVAPGEVMVYGLDELQDAERWVAG